MLMGPSFETEKAKKANIKCPSNFPEYLIIFPTKSALVMWSGVTVGGFYNKAYSLRKIEGIMTRPAVHSSGYKHLIMVHELV